MSEITPIQNAEDEIMRRIESLEPTKRQRILRKFISAALGAIPWIGGFLAARIAFSEESSQIEINKLNKEWLEEHKTRFRELALDLAALTKRLDDLGDGISERLESDTYLALVRKAFRVYDQADTDLKRSYICKLIGNAAATKLTEDDIVRLFIDWLERYHEAHFMIIREVYRNPGSTRADIWENIHGTFPDDNSSEADLYRLLIHDLSTGRIIRQHRETNYQGQFLKKTRSKRPPSARSSTMKSAFDDEESYELTELGKQFVHYVFSEIVQRLDQTNDVKD